jgi:NDP-sugar pyrophosphorylase family protein
MEIIIMKSGAYRELMEKLDAIDKYIRAKRVRKPVTDDLWLDNDAVCTYLKVSRRTLQRYRASGTIAYPMIGHKTYYKGSEVQRMLEKRHTKRESEPSSEE